MNIILAGPGRSGTTLFNHIFSHHEEFAWISGWLNRYPTRPELSVFNPLYQKQNFGLNWAHIRIVPKPAEAYGFWYHYFKPFADKNKNFDIHELNKCKSVIKGIMKYSRKEHFVTKITGETRFQILEQLFDGDLKYLWIERDPRVVVSSYIKQKWAYKKRPEAFEALEMEEKIRFYSDLYLKFYEGLKNVNDYNLYFYEDLCNDPINFFKDIFKDLDLTLSPKLEKIILNWNLKPVGWDSHYKSRYTEEQQQLFHKLLEEPLNAYGYTKP